MVLLFSTICTVWLKYVVKTHNCFVWFLMKLVLTRTNVVGGFVLGLLKLLEIPRGARHIMIQELKATPHILGM